MSISRIVNEEVCVNKTRLKNEIWNHFKKMQNIFLATIDGKKPRVRPVTLIHFRKKLWVLTGTKNKKTKQLKKNKNIEFCLPLRKGKYIGYIRSSGYATIVRDKMTKKSIANNVSYFRHYWKDINDPGYTLLNIRVKTIDYLKPGSMKLERLSL
jgi:general stress protein 26